jgi:hypothetical protein
VRVRANKGAIATCCKASASVVGLLPVLFAVPSIRVGTECPPYGLVEQAAAASGAMHEQAGQLMQAVSVFKLADQGRLRLA